jgi:hypothetical protein
MFRLTIVQDNYNYSVPKFEQGCRELHSSIMHINLHFLSKWAYTLVSSSSRTIIWFLLSEFYRTSGRSGPQYLFLFPPWGLSSLNLLLEFLFPLANETTVDAVMQHVLVVTRSRTPNMRK